MYFFKLVNFVYKTYLNIKTIISCIEVNPLQDMHLFLSTPDILLQDLIS